MPHKFILAAEIGDQMVAFPAADVLEVIEPTEITPVPGAPDWVLGIVPLRSRPLTAIDCRRAMCLPAATDRHVERLPVVRIGEFAYAFYLDRVLDAAPAQSEVRPLDRTIGARWDEVVCGLVETGYGTALMIDPQRLVSGPKKKCA